MTDMDQNQNKIDPTIITLAGTATMDFRNCEFGKNYLKLDAAIGDEDLREIGKGLRRVDRALPWWVGDLLLVAGSRLGKPWVAAFARECGYSGNAAYRFMSACAVFPPEKRIAEASLWLHSEAYLETNDIDAALKWVRRAVDEHMTTGEMRGAIRDSVRAVNKTAATNIATRRYSGIYQAIAEVRKLPLDEVTETDRETLIDDTAALWEWLAGLRHVDLRQIAPAAGPFGA